MMRRWWIGLTMMLAGLAAAGEETVSPEETAKLHALFEREWEYRLREDPLLATAVGRSDYDHLLPSVSAADEKRREVAGRKMLAELETIDRSKLGPADRVSYDVFAHQLRDAVSAYEVGAYLAPLTTDTGFHIDFARLPAEMPFADAEDYESYIARLRAFPELVEQYVTVLSSGLLHGMTLPRAVLDGYEVTIAAHVVDDPTESVFYRPFETFPTTMPEDERERLREAGVEAIRDGAVRGYRRFAAFFTGEYRPGARETIGASELPNGEAYYAQRIRSFTTLDLDAREIHEIGLAEVARIRAEMDAIIDEVDFDGDFAAFLEFLRTDPRFYAETPEALLREASYISKRADAALPALFGTLPRQPYGVAPVPDHLAPKYTTGRYIGAPPGSTQPGYYWVNTYDLPSRPLYVLTALTLHEAVPGHHLQIALAQELDDLPPFRRFSYLSAFGEGWGLYSEWLGLEAGLYEDPYSRFGRLTYEMWRACRLVVDTGMHAMGWSRQKAFDFLASNTALSLHEVGTEIDRYISWPGQALAYKLGELKIRELRRRAETALGERFDVRAFHDAVLRNGSIPLPVLETVIDEHIRAQKR